MSNNSLSDIIIELQNEDISFGDSSNEIILSSAVNLSSSLSRIDPPEMSGFDLMYDMFESIKNILKDFNPLLILNSSVAATHLDNANSNADTFSDLVRESFQSVTAVLDDIYNFFTGNRLQEDENRREMLDVLSKIGSDNPKSRPITSSDKKESKESDGAIKAGISAGIASVIAARVAKMFSGLVSILPKSFGAGFLPIASFFAKFLKFGKVLIKFAGPIGIAISVITGLIGAIRGGIEGYKEEGIPGAIKGVFIGAIDALVGTLVKGLADALGWLLKAIGLKEIGGMLGPSVKGLFDGIFKNIKGFVDIFTGIFTLDSDKVIKGIKTVITASLGNLKIIGSMVLTLVKELGPLIWKSIKFMFLDLPKFIGEGIKKLWDFLWSEDGQKMISDGISKISSFLHQLWDGLLTEVWPLLKEKFANGIKQAKTLLGEMVDGILNWFKDNFNWKSIKESIFEGVDFIQGIIDATSKFFTNLLKGITDFFDKNSSSTDNMFGKTFGDAIEDARKKLLRAFLPDKNAPWNSAAGVLSTIIPDEIYDYAESPTSGERRTKDIQIVRDAYKQHGISTKGLTNEQLLDEDVLNDKFKAKGVMNGAVGLDAVGLGAGRAFRTSSSDETNTSNVTNVSRVSSPTSITSNDNRTSERVISPMRIVASPSNAGAMLNEAKSVYSMPFVINQMGGNITNTSTSHVNNNTTPFEPIMTGTSLGFASV